MRRIRIGLAATVTFNLLAFAQTPPASKAIVGASVVKLDGSPAISDAVVVIDGDRITAVGPAATTKVPASAEVLRVTGKWIVPA